MEIVTNLGPVSVLAVTGKIDGSTFQQLIDNVDTVIQQGHKNVVLDFKGVSYLSSAGIVALQTILGRINGLGGQLALAGVTSDVNRTLDLVGATTWLNLYPDVATAQNSFDDA